MYHGMPTVHMHAVDLHTVDMCCSMAWCTTEGRQGWEHAPVQVGLSNIRVLMIHKLDTTGKAEIFGVFLFYFR